MAVRRAYLPDPNTIPGVDQIPAVPTSADDWNGLSRLLEALRQHSGTTIINQIETTAAIQAIQTDIDLSAYSTTAETNVVISDSISAEAAARDAAIADAIGAEVTNRNSAISAAIATEVTNRNSAISTAVAAEASARDAAIASALSVYYTASAVDAKVAGDWATYYMGLFGSLSDTTSLLSRMTSAESSLGTKLPHGGYIQTGQDLSDATTAVASNLASNYYTSAHIDSTFYTAAATDAKVTGDWQTIYDARYVLQ